MPKLAQSEMLWIYSMGKRFPVTAIFHTTEEANKYCESHDTEGVIAEIQGIIFIAGFHTGIKAE